MRCIKIQLFTLRSLIESYFFKLHYVKFIRTLLMNGTQPNHAILVWVLLYCREKVYYSSSKKQRALFVLRVANGSLHILEWPKCAVSSQVFLLVTNTAYSELIKQRNYVPQILSTPYTSRSNKRYYIFLQT